MKRATVLFAVLTMMMSFACKKADKADEGNTGKDDKPTPAAKMVDKEPEAKKATKDYATQEAKLARFKECWAAYTAAKNDAFKDCYADSTDFRVLDSIPEMAANDPAGVLGITAMFQKAFPKMKAEHQLVLINGNDVASITFQSGTNSGEMMGMPATNKNVGMLHAQVSSVDNNGKVTRDYHLDDQLSMMKQLGVLPEEAAARSAAAMEKGWDETFEVLAKNDDTEKANVETVKTLIGNVEKGDSQAVIESSTDDVIWHYVAGNEGAKSGKEAYKKSLDEFIGMTSARKLETTKAWAAGDWVVVEETSKATMGIDFGKAKTKGKSATQHEIHFFQLADGKVQRHYLFANDLNMMVQLGIIDPAMLAKPPAGDKK